MTMIAGVHIHPGYFKARRTREEPRVGAGPVGARVKPTVTSKPSNPKAKYAMPVIAVVAAIASFAGGAAIAFAAEATIGAMIAGGAMMVGAALTVVGTITGNQNLVKWGGYLSIAGGVGALGLGLAGALTEGAASAAESTTAGLSAGDAEQALANQQVGGAAATPAVPSAEPVGLMPTEAAANPALAASPQPVEAPAATPGIPTAPTPADLAPKAPDALGAQAPVGPNAYAPNTPTMPSATGAFDANSTTPSLYGAQVGPAAPNSASWYSRSADWMRANPELTRAGFNATGMLASSLIPKPLNDLDRATANLYNTRTQTERMRAGLAPGWWYGRAGG